MVGIDRAVLFQLVKQSIRIQKVLKIRSDLKYQWLFRLSRPDAERESAGQGRDGGDLLIGGGDGRQDVVLHPDVTWIGRTEVRAGASLIFLASALSPC